MLPQGPKRGAIRETVGFEERKAEREKMGGGLGDGAWHGVRWDGGTHRSRPTTVYFCRAGPVCPAGCAVGSMWCVGEGLCPSRGQGRTSPLRRMWWCAGGFIVYIRGGLW